MQCTIAGCCSPATTYSRLCAAHRDRDRTHGHPLQRGVTKAELRPYHRAVRRYLQNRAGKGADAIIANAWSATLRRAQETVDAAQRGRPFVKWELQAAELVLEINREHEASEIAETMLAMGYWLAFEPRRWASDDGFKFQAARMFRRLAPGTGRYSWKQDGGLARSSYPRVPKRLMFATWAIIKQTEFTDWGVLMAREDLKAAQVKRRDTIAERAVILGPLATTRTTGEGI